MMVNLTGFAHGKDSNLLGRDFHLSQMHKLRKSSGNFSISLIAALGLLRFHTLDGDVLLFWSRRYFPSGALGVSACQMNWHAMVSGVRLERQEYSYNSHTHIHRLLFNSTQCQKAAAEEKFFNSSLHSRVLEESTAWQLCPVTIRQSIGVCLPWTGCPNLNTPPWQEKIYCMHQRSKLFS